jgi:hypothetical protein
MSLIWCLPFRHPDRNFVCISHLSHACYIPRLSYLSRFCEACKLRSSPPTALFRSQCCVCLLPERTDITSRGSSVEVHYSRENEGKSRDQSESQPRSALGTQFHMDDPLYSPHPPYYLFPSTVP